MRSSSKVVWDIPVRLFHWLLASCVGLNIFILEEGEIIHRRIGYLACLVVIARLAWKFRTSTLVSVRSFPIHIQEVISFAKNKFSDPEERYEGHNPLASLVYFLIWICILSLGVSGWMMGLDAFWGIDWVEELHEIISKVLQILIVIHFTGFLLDSFRKKRKTWASMFTGKK